MKHVKHASETTNTLETYTCNIRNIQMKHLKTTSKTHLKQNMAPPTAMTYLVGKCGSQQAWVTAVGGRAWRGGGKGMARWEAGAARGHVHSPARPLGQLGLGAWGGSARARSRRRNLASRPRGSRDEWIRSGDFFR
jgi:hypothetical protein